MTADRQPRYAAAAGRSAEHVWLISSAQTTRCLLAAILALFPLVGASPTGGTVLPIGS